MHRRSLLKSTLAIVGFGTPAFFLSSCMDSGPTTSGEDLDHLLVAMKEIYNPVFDQFSQARDLDELLVKVQNSNLLTDRFKPNGKQILLNARTDDIVEIEGVQFTRSEVLLYTLAAVTVHKLGGEMPDSAKLVSLPKVDFVGGDLRSLKPANGLAGCMDACSDNNKCSAFTFALETHPNPGKRGRCWLKNSGFRYRKANHYVSGIKP